MKRPSDELRELIRQAELTPEGVARLLDLSDDELAAWLAGEREVPASLFEFLRNYLKVKCLAADLPCPVNPDR